MAKESIRIAEDKPPRRKGEVGTGEASAKSRPNSGRQLKLRKQQKWREIKSARSILLQRKGVNET